MSKGEGGGMPPISQDFSKTQVKFILKVLMAPNVCR